MCPCPRTSLLCRYISSDFKSFAASRYCLLLMERPTSLNEHINNASSSESIILNGSYSSWLDFQNLKFISLPFWFWPNSWLTMEMQWLEKSARWIQFTCDMTHMTSAMTDPDPIHMWCPNLNIWESTESCTEEPFSVRNRCTYQW